MTDNTQVLDVILNKYAEHYFDQLEGFGSMHTLNKTEAKQAILDWHNKQIAKAQIRILEQEKSWIEDVNPDISWNIEKTIKSLSNTLKEHKAEL